MNGWIRQRLIFNLACYLAALALSSPAGAIGSEAQWIWAPEHAKEAVPTGEACHFRKSLTIRAPEGGQIALMADDQYELFVNGRRVGAGEATKKMAEFDVSRHLVRGANVIAVKAQNTSGNTAALAARVTIKDHGE